MSRSISGPFMVQPYRRRYSHWRPVHGRTIQLTLDRFAVARDDVKAETGQKRQFSCPAGVAGRR